MGCLDWRWVMEGIDNFSQYSPFPPMLQDTGQQEPAPTEGNILRTLSFIKPLRGMGYASWLHTAETFEPRCTEY